MRPFVLIAGVVFSAFAVVAQDGSLAGTLLNGTSFPCLAGDSRGLQSWPCSLKFSGTPAKVTGELTWTTLASVHRIAGAISGNTLQFAEVSAITASRAHLNSTYTLTRSGSGLTGTYVDGVDNSRGPFSINIQGTAPSSTPGTRSGGGVDLNGSWQSGLLHIWQDGETLLVTASWKRADGKWVIWRANARLQGNSAVLQDVLYSPMPHGKQNPAQGHFTISADGNQIDAYYIVDGKRDPQNFQYHRDR
jgi:hypothetical protein